MTRTAFAIGALAGAAALALNGLVAAPAAASTFDTTTAWNGTDFILPFGNPNTATYGQTFIAPTDNVLNDFTFYLNDRGQGITEQLQAQVYAWSGALTGGNGPQGATGPALFTSAPITVGPTGGAFVPVTVNTGGVALTAGANYVALFTISGPDPSDYANSNGLDVWGNIGGISGRHVANDGGGGFNFYNNGSNFAAINTTAWDDFADFGDSAWKADFSSVPEPGTLALIGAGMAACGLTRRRRQV